MGPHRRRVWCHRLRAVELKIGMVSERRTKKTVKMFTDLDKSIRAFHGSPTLAQLDDQLRFQLCHYIHTNNRDEAWKLLPLVILDGITIFQDTVDSLGECCEFVKVCSEFLGIGDVEEDIKLGLLWKAALAK